MDLSPYNTAGDKYSQQRGGGGEPNKIEYGANFEFRNCTREKFDWDTDDDLYGLLDQYGGRHPNLVAEFPGVILD